MGEVLVVIKVLPKSMENFEEFLENIKEGLSKFGEVVGIREEPIAFGLKAALVGIKIPDEEGKMPAIEEFLNSNPLVGSFSVETTTRI